MKHFAHALLTPLFIGLALPLIPAAAQAEDIMSILARQAESPTRFAPNTIDYVYTLTVDLKEREGKELTESQAVLRIDPTQPPGSRAKILSASDADSDGLKDFLEEIEDPDNTMTKQAEGFWCGASETESETDLSPDDFIVVSEDDTQAVLKPKPGILAELLIMESDGNADKNDLKMMKKLVKRIDGEMTLAKPSGEVTGFSVRMTRPLTMMLVAKLKVMTVEQSCEMAPNGHYRIGTMKMNVEGKALGSRFGQELDMRISNLTPLP